MKAAGRLAGVLFALFAVSAARGQMGGDEFGKNKVQYTRFQWSYIQSDHFDVYFSQGGEYLANFTAMAAESAYASASASFHYQLVNRVPIVVYNSHNEFQQTNVLNEYLEEGIGGVTELFKNRVVLPFEGDYRKFRHVIHHELVHAIINDMFYGGSIQSIISNNITLQLPLWFNEGLAEYEAQKWETDSDMFLRDATVHEYLPSIERLYGYYAYRGGQSLWWYISNKYGPQKIGDILNRIKSTRSVEAGFRAAIGQSLEDLSERWQKEMKVTYWPDIARREEPADYARRLTDNRKDGGFYNTSPAITPQGDKVAFISDRGDYFNVYVMNASDGKDVEKIVSGNTTNNFEELHLLTPGISWSPDSKRLAIAAKAGDQDAILLLDVKTGAEEKLSFGLDGIFSVEWSPSGSRLAFVGNVKQQSDIFIYDLQSKQLTNLTNDMYSDGRPAWSPDESTIYFSSDRGGATNRNVDDMMKVDYSQDDLYSINVKSGEIARLLDWPRSNEGSPVVSPDGKKLLFLSDRNGINNVYELTLETKKWRPMTNSLSGVYQLSLSRDGSKMVFSSLNNQGFNIFLMRNPFDRTVKAAELEPTEFYKAKYAARDTAAKAIDTVAAVKPAQVDTSGLYGNSIQIDFSTYTGHDVYADAAAKDSLVSRLPPITANVDENGKYKVNRYKLNFSPDIIYGNAGYDTFYGVTGSTVMAFSDLLGDHQIVFATNLLLDLKNSDFMLQYYYLPNRIDYMFGGFHSARFVSIYDQYGGSIYRFRTYGASVAALYPIDRFNRIDFGLNWFNISKENIDVPEVPVQYRTVVLPSLSYTHDTALWGYTAPANGSRYKVSVFGTPKLGSSGLSFIEATADYRTYLRLGRNYSFAFRLSGGGSFGKNPQKFIIGGTENWINRNFEGGYVPLDNAEDYIFLMAALPLRGYNYNTQIGTKYGLFNFEFRYPLFAFLQAGPLPIGLQSIGGVMFFDMGSAWTKERNYVAFTRDETGSVVSRDLLMGMGTGARVFFLAFLVRVDVAWAWYVNGFSEPKYYFSLGADF
jgi:Tol biopolymer transport system component